ncbi:phage baseplate assembly protein V [Maridesulfovibrio sp.]|uniref:phage baseplate assembly protein V n=1 Tax=unclassified Maridesulfovibrio TaxID=2794999 RepID=UPI003B005F48
MHNASFNAADLTRRLANIVRFGTIAEADYQNARVRVAFGEDAVSDWLPWADSRAGGDRSWHAPEEGEQVIVLSPSGETSAGVVLTGIFSTEHPAPADRASVARMVFKDGAVLEYDRENHVLRADVPGKVIVNAEGEIVAESKKRIVLSAPQLVFDGPITHGNSTHGGGAEFNGKIIHRNGDLIQLDGDTVSQGISLQNHVHPETGRITREPSGGE